MVNPYDKMGEQLDLLTESFKSGTLTEQQLDEAVNIVVNMRDDYSRSVGFEWIQRNSWIFRDVVADVPAFLWRHVENYYFGVLVVLHVDLLELLPEADRARYIRASVMQHGTRNKGWINAAQKVGVTNEALAEIVLDRLRATVVRPGSTNFVDEFLRYGIDTEWDVLTDEQLKAALQICFEKSPANVLAKGSNISERLGEETSLSFKIAAAGQLDQVHHRQTLRLLPLKTQAALLRRIEKIDSNLYGVTAEFIVEVAVGMGMEFYHEMQPLIEQIDAGVFVMSVYTMLEYKIRHETEEASKENAKKIKQLVLKRCKDAGYLIGTVTEGTYMDRSSMRERRQLQVQVDGHTYVEPRYQSARSYYPSVGDTVLIYPNRGRKLTPRVTSVYFNKVQTARTASFS